MGAIWLRDLEQVLRSSNPIGPILTVPGWENRSNASGGYEAMRGLVVHHTASGPSADGWPDVNYETFQDAEKPNAMLKVSRRGEVFIMTAGSANTQGLGGPIIGVPLNRGNFQLIGIELSNNGVGEPYPNAQQSATLWLCKALVASYGKRFGWNHNSVISHFEWAPARKNDPAGPSRWSPGGGRWNMAAFRNDVGTLPTPPPGGFIVSPEDLAYMERKFATLQARVDAVHYEDLEDRRTCWRAGEMHNIMRDRAREGVVSALIDNAPYQDKFIALVTQGVKVAGGQIDPAVLKQAIQQALAGVAVPATLDPAQLAAVAKVVNDEAHRRSEA